MPLEQDQIAKVQQHRENVGAQKECPSCGVNKWSVGELVGTPRFTPGGGTLMGGSTVPMVQVICTRCGYIMHYSAKIIGLVS